MPPIVIDLVISVLILGMTYALISEGLWGSALMFFNVLFASMVAFNFYEPLAALLAQNLSFLSGFADTLCLMSLFLIVLVVLRLTTETLAPAMVRFPGAVYQIGRIFFGLAGATLTMAVLLLAFETAPVHKKVFTVVDYQSKPPFNLGIDSEFLGFFQRTTGEIFADYSSPTREPYSYYGNAKVFDPRGEWILNHQTARPYGDESILAEAAPAAGAAPAGGGAPGGRPGDPQVVGPGPGGGVVIPPP